MFILFLVLILIGPFGSFYFEQIGGTFNYSDPGYVMLFLFVLFSAILKNKNPFDVVGVLGIILVIILMLSGFENNTFARREFLFPFKNFFMFSLIYIISFNLVDTQKKFHYLIYTLSAVCSILVLQAAFGLTNQNLYDVAYDRTLRFAGEMVWNSLVGTLSFLFPIVLFAFWEFYCKKKFTLVIFILIILFSALFMIVLSGGRQALGTIVIITLLFIYYQKWSSKVAILTLIVIGMVSTFWIVDTYFHYFYSFAESKRSVADHEVEHRFIYHFINPIMDFPLEYVILGNGISNEHNIVTSILYRFGLFGWIIYWLRFMLLWNKINVGYKQHAEYFDSIFNYPINKIFLLLFISFFVTNFVANIWYQVPYYGYLIEVMFGALSGIAASKLSPVGTKSGIHKY